MFSLASLVRCHSNLDTGRAGFLGRIFACPGSATGMTGASAMAGLTSHGRVIISWERGRCRRIGQQLPFGFRFPQEKAFPHQSNSHRQTKGLSKRLHMQRDTAICPASGRIDATTSP